MQSFFPMSPSEFPLFYFIKKGIPFTNLESCYCVWCPGVWRSLQGQTKGPFEMPLLTNPPLIKAP